jgi:ATP-dependent protease ClpP protease subunit
MKEKVLQFDHVADYNVGGKSTIDLFAALDGAGEVSEKFVSEFKYLESISSEIEIKINCSGGSVVKGLNIINAILDCQVPTTSRIVGIAASMASVIALCTDKTVIADYALIMWHNPYSPTGDKQDDQLDAFAGMLRKIYSNRLGLDEKGIEEFMNGDDGKDGTWFNAEKALELGIVTEIEATEIQKSLEDNLSELEASFATEEIENELQGIAANLMLDKVEPKEKQNDTDKGDEEVVSAFNNSPINKKKGNMEGLEAISASLNIENADLEAIAAKVKEVVANNVSLEKINADKNGEIVAAKDSLVEKEIELVAATSEVEKANKRVIDVEAKFSDMEAKIVSFEAEKAEAHEKVIEDLVNDACDAGKFDTEAKSTWTTLLQGNFEFAKTAIAGLSTSEVKKVKLSDKVSASSEEVIAKVEVESKVDEPKAEFVSMEAKMAEIKKNNKR